MANPINFRRGALANLPATANDGEPLWVNDSGNEALYVGRGALLSPFLVSAGGGNVTKSGAPAVNQIGVWVSDGVIEGTNAFLFDDTNVVLSIGDDGGTRWVKINHDAVDANLTTGSGNLNIIPDGIVVIDTDLKLGLGQDLVFDDDDDTYFTTSADDNLDVFVGGGLRYRWTTGITRSFVDFEIQKTDAVFYLGQGGTNRTSWLGASSTVESKIGVGTVHGRQLILTSDNNLLKDHDHAVQANPTLFIHSVTDPDVDNTEWLSLSHTGTDAFIDVGGSGSLIFGSNIITGNSVRVGGGGTAAFFEMQGNSGAFSKVGFNFTFGETLAYLGSNHGNQFIFSNGDVNLGKNHDHPNPTDPTVFIHSATDVDSDNTQWLSMRHDQTNAVFEVGTGDFVFDFGTRELNLTDLGSGVQFGVPAGQELRFISGSTTILGTAGGGTSAFSNILFAYQNDVGFGSTVTGSFFDIVNAVTNQQLAFGLNTNQGLSYVLTTVGNRDANHDHGVQSDPTLWIHSGTDPDADNTQYIGITHDTTDAKVMVGAGALDISSPDQGVIVPRLSADPVSGTNGEMYYNTTSNKFRGFENGAWANLI